MRCDIPLIEDEEDFVLYTDCDVIFLKDVEIQTPEYFSCSPEFDIEDTARFNTGVMFMNIKNLKRTYDGFAEFINENLSKCTTWDQSAYQLYYKGKNTLLDTKFNHKPYYGINEEASIVHYHGGKPTLFTDEDTIKNLSCIHGVLYKRDLKSSRYYLEIYKKYAPEITYCEEGLRKLESGEYPLNQPPAPKVRWYKKLKKFIHKKFSNPA